MTTALKDTPVLSESEREAQAEADRRLDFFSIFIHDLESPLASVKYLMTMLSENRLDMANEKHRALVQSSRLAVQRAESILYDIMAVAKAGRTGIPVSVTSLKPQPLIAEAIAMAAPSVEEHRLSVEFDSAKEPPPVTADPRLLSRVMDNLIYNAIRHTTVGGTIRVYTETERHSVYIHVKDDGPGLGDIEPAKLFEKYGQLQLRTEGKHRGVGLGLYFCKLAATGMGGTIMADDHPDGGAVFSIKLKKAKG